VDLTVPSHTFHGRDVFAPVAGLLAAGSVAPKDVGPRVHEDLVPAPFAEPVLSREGITGQIVLIDRFGNLITNVTGAMMREQQATAVQVRGETLRLARTYADVALGELVALENAFGLVEIACRDSDARQRTGLGIGESVWVHRGGSA
jgi:S-adenosylmethionine hydrolase